MNIILKNIKKKRLTVVTKNYLLLSFLFFLNREQTSLRKGRHKKKDENADKFLLNKL